MWRNRMGRHVPDALDYEYCMFYSFFSGVVPSSVVDEYLGISHEYNSWRIMTPESEKNPHGSVFAMEFSVQDKDAASYGIT